MLSMPPVPEILSLLREPQLSLIVVPSCQTRVAGLSLGRVSPLDPRLARLRAYIGSLTICPDGLE